MNNRALFIDFDGTICFDLFWRSLPPDLNNQINNLLFHNNENLINSWMIGKFSSEDINSIISQNLKIEYEYLWDIFVNDCKKMSIRIKTLELLQKAKTYYKTILITDNMDCFDRFTVPSLNLRKNFDYIENSYNHKMLKSSKDGVFFKEVAQSRNINLKDSILIDNSYHNCNIFEQLGGESISVLKPEDIEIHLQSLFSKS